MDNTSSVATRITEIAIGERVEDPSSSTEYKLTRYLGSGKYSHVYAAEPVSGAHGSGDGQSKVVKFGFVSPEDMGGSPLKTSRLEELKLRFDQELAISEQIRKASSNLYVPFIIKGKWVNSERNIFPVLIMDRMGNDLWDWSLAQQIREHRDSRRLVKAERLAVAAGAQYAELLQILHKTLNKACPDRKPSDFYWNPSSERLYVLDWNVVEDLPDSRDDYETSSTPSSKRANKIQTEIRQFGERWFEMLVGTAVSSIDDLRVDQPTAGSSWAQLSQGMRRLLVRTLTVGLSQEGFETDEAVRTAWKAYGQLLSMSSTGLYEQASSEREKARENGGDKREWTTAWDTISDIQVLLETKQESDAQARAREIGGWISKRDGEVENQFGKKFDPLKSSIELGDYDQAVAQLRSLAEDERFDAAHRLDAARWSIAAQSLSVATSQSSEKGRKLRDQLIPLLDDMQRKDWTAAHQKLETIKTRDSR